MVGRIPEPKTLTDLVVQGYIRAYRAAHWEKICNVLSGLAGAGAYYGPLWAQHANATPALDRLNALRPYLPEDLTPANMAMFAGDQYQQVAAAVVREVRAPNNPHGALSRETTWAISELHHAHPDSRIAEHVARHAPAEVAQLLHRYLHGPEGPGAAGAIPEPGGPGGSPPAPRGDGGPERSPGAAGGRGARPRRRSPRRPGGGTGIG